jgi:hypothetical protein
MSARLCFECDATENLYDHHVVPRSYGGTRTVVLCGQCHAKVHQARNLTDVRVMTKTALAVKKGRGERTGSVPYGSRLAADGVHLEPDPDGLKAIVLARQLRSEGLSLRAIGARLTAAGCTPRGGAGWNPNTIARLL